VVWGPLKIGGLPGS